ncbi:MAG: nicotinate phosphoribosyltransferase [Candidatus Alcyoniella australis]|nr:nicotinate phosphoribosyltransferase [Candidatus Alcyoniella australis]
MSGHGALLTDLYELTMAASYHQSGFCDQACFELFVRKLPPKRNYLLVAGLEQALDFLENLHFTGDQIDYLRSHPVFADVAPSFFEMLAELRFSGSVSAIPEGGVAFAGEPLLQVRAPLIEAQIVETYLLSQITFQTMIATKASRICSAARGRAVVDFGSRRAHGPEAAVLAARACFIGGCAGTSNVEAGQRFDVPIFGTVAHSQIMAYGDEQRAFAAYLRDFPHNATLLIDTYDTLAGARIAASFGPQVTGVRIDSGDLVRSSNEVRAILDQAGMQATKIVASSDLDEYRIDKLLSSGASINLFGVGTQMVTSADAPNLSGVYKLVQIQRDGQTQPAYKNSTDKATLPWAKQVWRATDQQGLPLYDLLTRRGDPGPATASPQLVDVMESGRRIEGRPSLESIKQRAAEQLGKLPESARHLDARLEYDVRVDPGLKIVEE